MNLTPAALSALAKGDIENFIIASTPGGIEQQESYGQIDLCTRHTSNPRLSKLPKHMQECNREDFEKIGIKFLDDADDIFVNVELPQHWSLIPTSHDMWNTLIDNNGSERAQIFYKAAFYDRRATIYKPLTRFYMVIEYVEDSNFEKIIMIKDRKLDSIIYESPVCDDSTINEFKEDGFNYLNAHYPEWQDFTKYWD